MLPYNLLPLLKDKRRQFRNGGERKTSFLDLVRRGIQERRPLSETARRSGWVGCNILLDRLPPDGWIEIIKDGSVRSPGAVRDDWRRFSFLRKSTARSRGWTSDVLRCVRKLGKSEFTLKEMYDFEEELRELHPKNRHVRPKIRQQLQILRDNGTLRFIAKGRYLVKE